MAQTVGRSRGGRTSKVHGLTDHRGQPVAFALTPGNVADITMALPLLTAVRVLRRLLADKAYDADSLRGWLKKHSVKAVIPSTATRMIPYPLDHRAYRRRNVIECLFCRLRTGDAGRPATIASPNNMASLALLAIISEWRK